jgi:hypothetical protein
MAAEFTVVQSISTEPTEYQHCEHGSIFVFTIRNEREVGLVSAVGAR